MKMYNLNFLPVAKNDMVEIAKYISHELSNPTAAENLIEEMLESADRLAIFPYSNAVYVPLRPLNHEYRRLAVKNYILFYWVDEDKKTVTIARVIYSHRNYNRLLK